MHAPAKTSRTLPGEPRVHRWTKDEYYRAAELLNEGRVELLGGEIIDMSPIGPQHAVAVVLAHRALERAMPDFYVRDQLPFDASEDSEPEPDLAVLAGSPRDHRDAHPKQVALIVEVADWSVNYDRGRKASRYAASGVPDYWVMNLPQRQLEVFRDPRPDPTQPFGFGYASHTVVPADGTISPLVAPQAIIHVRDLLP
jgi:Uma2 family endonuclease